MNKFNKLTANLRHKILLNQWSILLLLCISLYLVIVPKFSLWTHVGVPHMKPLFLDMHAVLSAADASKDGYNVYVENPYDPLQRVHAYPGTWLWLQHTGLTTQHSTIVSLFVVSIFLMMSVYILKPDNSREFIISSTLMLSPAIMLGVERANNDLIIFIILGLAVLLLKRTSRIFHSISTFLIYLASILKIYPAVTFLLFAHFIRNKKSFWYFTALITCAFGIYLFLTYPDIVYLNKTIPRPVGPFTFGALPLLQQVMIYRSDFGTHLYLLFGLTFLLATVISRNTHISRITSNSPNTLNTLFFLAGSLNIIFCFFANSNYDYRCIFFIMALPLLFDFLKQKNVPAKTQKYTWTVIWLLPVVVLNELFITIMIPSFWVQKLDKANYLKIMITYLIEHLCSWIVITILLAFCIDLLKKPILEKLPVYFSSIAKSTKEKVAPS